MKQEVNQAVTQMDEVTQQNAALVEQAAAAAASLEQQAHELVGAISIFNVAQNAAKHSATVVQLTDKRTAERSNLHNSNSHLKKRSKIAMGGNRNQWNEI